MISKDFTTKVGFLITEKAFLEIKDLIFILSFAVLTGVSAHLKIEIGPIPITTQSLIVVLSGLFLGSKRGAASQLTYLTAGLAGLPWFSKGGGINYILSPSFGYILGFIPASYIAGRLVENGFSKSDKSLLLNIFISNFSIYIPGLLWLAIFLRNDDLLKVGFYPFLLGDTLKIFLGFLIFKSKGIKK